MSTVHLTKIDDFKLAFRHHPAGVAIVAARTPDGPKGLTVSSLASVSIEPCAISFSVTTSRGSAGAILDAPSFAISLLGAPQAHVAAAFAAPGAPRFTAEENWVSFPGGEPLLADAPTALRCRPLEVVGVGSSSLILAEVTDIRRGPDSAPLVHYDRTFHVVGQAVSVER